MREARRDGSGLEFLGVADYEKANVWEPKGRRAWGGGIVSRRFLSAISRLMRDSSNVLLCCWSQTLAKPTWGRKDVLVIERTQGRNSH